MSILLPKFDHSTIVRGAEAEVVGAPAARVKLLADSSATRRVCYPPVQVTLAKNADGARPHHHDHSAEMFYVLDGVVEILSGKQIVKAERGDVIVVPPKLPHAFSAAQGHGLTFWFQLIAPWHRTF